MTTDRRTIEPHFGRVSRPHRWLCGALLRWMGWTTTGDFPEDRKLVAIFAPHTSNWDFVIIYLMVTSRGIKGNFFAKHTLCRPPLGWFMRAVGAIPVVRRRTEHLVDSAVDALAAQYRNAAVQRHEMAPSEVGLDKLGHFGAFRRTPGPAAWRRWLGPVEAATPRLAGARLGMLSTAG